MTHLSEELLNAYKATTYAVPELGLKIIVDRYDELLERILSEQNSTTWAFITAWNPKSRELSLFENQTRNQSLLSQLKTQGFLTFKGEGIPDKDNWTPEESLFILGISRKQAMEMGEQYDQNAIVFGQTRKRAELIVTR